MTTYNWTELQEWGRCRQMCRPHILLGLTHSRKSYLQFMQGKKHRKNSPLHTEVIEAYSTSFINPEYIAIIMDICAHLSKPLNNEQVLNIPQLAVQPNANDLRWWCCHSCLINKNKTRAILSFRRMNGEICIDYTWYRNQQSWNVCITTCLVFFLVFFYLPPLWEREVGFSLDNKNKRLSFIIISIAESAR